MKLSVALCTLPLLVSGQTAETPRFLAADVHVSAKTQNQGMRPPSTRAARYEVKNATMVDLIGLAYGFNATRILGGPSWLEMDRFDVLAKQPPQTEPESQKLMIQALLAERFGLVVQKDTKPLPSYALTLGKKPQLKEADGSGETGCKPQSTAAGGAPGGEGVVRLSMGNVNGGAPVQLSLVNGIIEYQCRNMTMAAFAEAARGLLGANLGVNPLLDQTGLSGKWNFDLRFSLGLIGLPGMTGERITISEAIEKQLGLKLEEKQIPTPVLIVQSVNQKPSDNPPGTADALPPNSVPKEFEVATVKPTSPDLKISRFQMQPGGRLTAEGMPLRFLISRAFNTTSNDQIAGVPSWADTARFDVMAKAPEDSAAQTIDPDTLAPMMLALLKERFKLAYHMENRETPALSLVAAKPKMTKADSSARAWCKAPAQVPGAAPAPPSTQVLICQNITMAQFADLLRGRAGGLDSPILDSTGIEGGWDFRLTFNPVLSLNVTTAARPLEAGQPGNQGPAASDPANGYTIFEAMEKQLGLKLVKQKLSVPVLVIDHLEQTPTDN